MSASMPSCFPSCRHSPKGNGFALNADDDDRPSSSSFSVPAAGACDGESRQCQQRDAELATIG